MAEAAGKTELAGATSGALPPARHERRHGDEVIRVGRMTKAEKNRDSENDPDRSAVGGGRDALIEPEHRINSLHAALSSRVLRACPRNHLGPVLA